MSPATTPPAVVPVAPPAAAELTTPSPPTVSKADRLRQELADARSDVDRAKAAAVDRLHNGVPYFVAKTKTDTAKQLLDESRRKGETVSRLRLSSEYNTAAAAQRKMDDDCLPKDAAYQDAVARADRLQAELDAAIAVEPAPTPPVVATTPERSAPPASATPPAAPPPVASAGGSPGSGTHVGPRGGVYHFSKSGKKVYEKRK